MADNTLEELRKEIDQADEQLLKALARRMEAVQNVGVYKKENNLPPLDETRWQKVLEDKIAQAHELGLSEGLVKELYETIHKHALKLEEDV
jgi:chorismate mutase